ncbi:hypothetical protein JYU34_017061 [Plutella xylostella]|uniref:Retrovirus-related Pol polyprotein from transposon TNT 1-94 n=1 Tax=Plutella xylostella TaxID=51655 RepID=A0ABQ7Q5M5_PLUXY|nr:hypothetical protein JYU34_017061 [Plutella xylostella]
MSSNASAFSIDKLIGRDNYSTWKFAVQTYLEHEELWECVEGTNVDQKKDKKAKSKIILLVDPINYVHIEECTTSKEVWLNLQQAFSDSGLTRKVGLLKSLITTTLDSSSSVEDYVNKIMSTAHKLRNINFKVDDEWLGTLLLAGLPESYKPMLMALESSGTSITADLVKTKILQDVNIKPTENSALIVHKYGENSRGKSKGPRCFNCNKYGHYSKFCRNKNKKNGNQNTNTNFVAAFSAASVNDENNWYIDSGASAHMSRHRVWLENETAPKVPHVRVADDKVLKVISTGNIIIGVKGPNSSLNNIQVKDVLYVPDLATNLLSVSKIIESGCTVKFNEKGCIIRNSNGEIAATADRVNGTYRLNTNLHQALSSVTSKGDCNFLWHQRMGHINYNDLDKLQICAEGMKLSTQKEDAACTSCLEGKQTRQPFNHGGSRASELLELVHSDVCGPMENKSIGGSRYFLTFIDDYSRKVYVYMLTHKSEALEKFKEFKNQVENELNRKIKILRSDNGKEYVNHSFHNFLRSAGIIHQTSNPYTPEQNGLAERMNRTLVEKAKCMIFNACLQKEYWAEAISTAAYIVNRSPCRGLSSDATPYEVWTGSKPNISHMKVFGCQAMVHVPKERRQKWDPKSRELIFVGYSDTTKGYRFIDPKNKRVIMSRDVVFLEDTVQQTKISIETDNVKDKTCTNERYQSNTTCTPSKPAAVEIVHTHDDNRAPLNVSVADATIEVSSSSDEFEDTDYVPSRPLSPSTNVTVRTRRQLREQADQSDPVSYMCLSNESAMSVLDCDPQSTEEALKSELAQQWRDAMDVEYESLLENDTWILTDLPKGKRAIPCKWVYKTKRNENGEIVKYKARLVIKGYKQRKDIDYQEVFAPVVRYTSLRCLVATAANREGTVNTVKEKLTQKFKMKDLGEARFCIGLKITRKEDEISLDQSLYIEKILQRFGMAESKAVNTPCDVSMKLIPAKSDDEVRTDIPYHEAVGCLLYLSQGTRPDITYAVNMLSRFNSKPTKEHWIALKRVLRYLKGTSNMKLTYKKNEENIVGYCDADWASNIEDRRSCTGHVFLFQGAAISWASKRQLTVALSSTEAEYMSLTSAVQEALWLGQLHRELWSEQTDQPFIMYCDNQSTIKLSGSDVYHARSKHIDVRYHFIREKVSSRKIEVHYKSTDEMAADVLTKGLHRTKHEFCCKAMGLRSGEDDGKMERNSS